MKVGCSEPECPKPVFARKLCTAHYSRWLRYGDTSVVHTPFEGYIKPTCTVDGCDREAVARKLCKKHYQRWKKYGDPLVVGTKHELGAEERFWSYVDKNGPVPERRPKLGRCWVWTGGVAGGGYGAFWLNGHQVKAHIFSYTLIVGKIGAGHEHDHLCRNRICVNPAHIEAVTGRENVLRGESFAARNAIKTHCPQNHEYTPENTRINSQGKRVCIICARATCLRWYHKQKMAAKA